MENVGLRDGESGRFINKHGGRNEPLYGVWCAMKERCNNPHNKRYERYGGRGIKVCEEWANDYGSFRNWASKNGYTKGLTIDRIENNGGYCPENCRWVTRAEQNRNYSRNRMLTLNGETLCLADMAKKYGIKSATLRFRLNQGMSLEEAVMNVDRRTTRWQR